MFCGKVEIGLKDVYLLLDGSVTHRVPDESTITPEGFAMLAEVGGLAAAPV